MHACTTCNNRFWKPEVYCFIFHPEVCEVQRISFNFLQPVSQPQPEKEKEEVKPKGRGLIGMRAKPAEGRKLSWLHCIIFLRCHIKYMYNSLGYK